MVVIICTSSYGRANHIKTREGDVVLLFGAKDEEHNNAVALKEYIESRMGMQTLLGPAKSLARLSYSSAGLH